MKEQFNIMNSTNYAVLIVCLCLGFGIGIPRDHSKKCEHKRPDVFRNAAVTANGIECAAIGRNILLRGGSAADSAIATLLCEGVACPQSMGIGGGFLLTIYSKEDGIIETLIARETAPAAAHKDLYENDPSQAQTGGLSVAVPGELRGYWALHQRYGKLPWRSLFEPAIDLCKNGHIVSSYLANVLKSSEDVIKKIPSISEVFIDPITGHVYREGDRIRRPKLAATLQAVAEHGPDVLYNGALTKHFIRDIRDAGGIITAEDLANYRVRWEKPVNVSLPNGLTLHSVPLPASGVILTYMLRTLSGMIPGIPKADQITTWQRIIETFKFAYGARSNLGDYHFVLGMEEFVRHLSSEEFAEKTRSLISDTETHNNATYYGSDFVQTADHGTAQISVLAPNGDAVSVTSTINYLFGAMFRSPSTGIILNDEMDDFSIPNADNIYGVPPSPANYIVPGKRPLSSTCPSIVVDEEGDVRLVVGAAGGTKITTTVALTIIRHLWYNYELPDAVAAKRLHHQLYPMEIQYEQEFDEKILVGLANIGHNLTEVDSGTGFAALTAIAKINGNIYPSYDPRRGGSIAGY